MNSDTQKIANQGGNLTVEPWILTGLNNDEERKGPFSMLDDVQITNVISWLPAQWLEDMQLLDDGSLLIMLTQERDDGSANELMFFRLTGF